MKYENADKWVNPVRFAGDVAKIRRRVNLWFALNVSGDAHAKKITKKKSHP